MDIYLNLFLLAVIVVNIVDLSGFIDTLKHWIWKWVFKGQKEYRDFDFRPFECSYCSLHHVGLIYMLVVGEFSLLSYTYLLLLCVLTPVIKDLILTIRDIIQKIIDTVYLYLDL